MARKHKHEEHENHERWLVSYADFITLMFAFFVVMFASANRDKAKMAKISEAVEKAYTSQPKQIAAAISKVLGRSKSPSVSQNPGELNPGEGPKGPGVEKGAAMSEAEKIGLEQSAAVLEQELAKEIAAGKIQLTMNPRGLVISLKEAAFFPSGEDSIAYEMVPSVGKIADAILKLDNQVRLEGHTDAIPIHNPRFPTNWHLSSARGVAMLQLMAGRFKVPPERMAAVGFADTHPVDTNSTAAGRARNRRVDVVILNDAGAKSEPPLAAPAAQAQAGKAPAAAPPQAAKPQPAPSQPTKPQASPSQAKPAPPALPPPSQTKPSPSVKHH